MKISKILWKLPFSLNTKKVGDKEYKFIAQIIKKWLGISHHECKIKGKSYFYSQLHLVAERKAVFGYTEAWFFEESSLVTWLVISLQHYHWSMEILFLMGLLTSWGDKTSFFFFRNWKQREMCVRKDSTENLWLPLKLTTSESITVSLEWILLVRLISRSVNFSFLFFFFWIRVWKWWLSRVPGDVPSMECIQQ